MAYLTPLPAARKEIEQRIAELQKVLEKLKSVNTYDDFSGAGHVQPSKAEKEAGVCLAKDCFRILPLSAKQCYCDYEVCCENYQG